jgi:hypothetical protein
MRRGLEKGRTTRRYINCRKKITQVGKCRETGAQAARHNGDLENYSGLTAIGFIQIFLFLSFSLSPHSRSFMSLSDGKAVKSALSSENRSSGSQTSTSNTRSKGNS